MPQYEITLTPKAYIYDRTFTVEAKNIQEAIDIADERYFSLLLTSMDLHVTAKKLSSEKRFGVLTGKEKS